MSERVPEGWSPASFGDLAKVINGYAFQSSDFVEKSEISVPIIRMSSLKAGVIDLTDAVHVAEEKTKGLEKFLLGKGDFVFGMSGSISNFAIIKEQDGVCYQNQRVGRLSPINASREFVSQLFLSEGVTRQIEGLAAGGAQLNISSSQIENLNILNPPLPEQKKIASILTSVDEVIETTQKQIDKLQDLKKATMNELLTKGIGHTEFKDSELGQIPKSWVIVSFQEVFASYTYGPRFSSKDYSPNGNVKTIRGTDLTKDWNIDYKKVPLAALDEKVVAQHRLEDNDVVMITTADCGFSSVFQEQDIPFIASAYAIRLRPTHKIDAKFCVWYLQTSKAKDQIEKFERKGTVSNLPGSDVMKVKLPLPPIEEQSEIVKVLHSIDQNIAADKDKLAQTQSLKKSLMQDLLTGKVRVQVN